MSNSVQVTSSILTVIGIESSRSFGIRTWGTQGLWILALLVTCGCGRPDYMKETAPVSGKVTLDGKPVESGYIFVSPRIGRMAKSAIAEDGTFTLGTYETSDGAQVGTHSVYVTPVPMDEGGRRPPKVNIPEKYGSAATSGLELTVEPGTNNTVEFTLSSGN